MIADASLIGRQCANTTAPHLWAGIIRAVYLGASVRRDLPRPCMMFLVERMEEQDHQPAGTFWSTVATEVMLEVTSNRLPRPYTGCPSCQRDAGGNLIADCGAHT